MHSHCKIAGVLTSTQLDVMKSLHDLSSRQAPAKFWPPRELGAYRSSHHGHTLGRLLELGYVARAQLESSATRPRFGYQITAAGRQLWLELKDLLAMPSAQVLGGQPDQARLTLGRRLVG